MSVVIPSATIILIKILALDCNADQAGCWRFHQSLSIKLKLKISLWWYWSPRIQACSLKVRFTSLCGLLIPRPIAWWGGACVAGSSWKPATPCLATCWKWMRSFYRLVSEMTSWSWWRVKGFKSKVIWNRKCPTSIPLPRSFTQSLENFFLFIF